jgi:hypothetical protein
VLVHKYVSESVAGIKCTCDEIFHTKRHFGTHLGAMKRYHGPDAADVTASPWYAEKPVHGPNSDLARQDSGLFTPAELDEWERKVLRLLCVEGKYHSSVLLAADLYGTTEDVQETRVLEWNLVELILQDLNTKGLVTYRFGAFELFVHLRPTKEAYKYLRMEDPTFVRTVGIDWHSMRELPVRSPEDRTDFRTHGYQAEGSDTPTKEDFIDHCGECDHLAKHTRQLIELYGSADL